jgi:hypothetical protein
MVASKCPQDRFLSEKYRTVRPLQQLFHQNSPLVQLYASASNCKSVGNIPGSHFLKPFQLFRCILNDVSSITKPSSLQYWFQSWEQVKSSCRQVRRVWGMFQCCFIVLCWESLDQNRPVCWSIDTKEKSNVSSPFSMRFLLTASLRRRRISSIKKLSLCSNYCKLYQRIPGIFEAITDFWSCYVKQTKSLLQKNLVHYLDPATCVS